MTEEIIINGINVAGCEFYFKDEKHSCNLSFINQEELCNCDNINDCYYKQLKRLEQENFALTQESQQKSQTICELKQAYERLEHNHNFTVKDYNKYNKLTVELTEKNIELHKQIDDLKQENKELKEWKERVVKLFESACRCKYLNEEKDICSYTNEKCININKCVYKYQELSDTYRSALEEIRTYLNTLSSIDSDFTNTETYLRIQDKINEVLK